jgi:hypothetical protein
MRFPGHVVAIGLIALVVVSAASAKGSVPREACGAERCVLLDGGRESLIFLDGDARRPAPPPAPYYRLAYSAAGVGPHYFVARGRLLAVETAGGRALQWYALNGTGPNRLRAAIRDLAPYEAPDEWPTRIEAPVSSREGGTDTFAWLIGALLVALAAGAVIASRVRVRSPKTA